MNTSAISERLAGRRFHLIGIGGAGMSVVAELLSGQGAIVTGSDRQGSAVLDALRGKGIGAYWPHEADAVPPDATVVVSSAIRPTNPELVRARSRGQAEMHRSTALALAAGDQPFIAVAGAHGKTSTSAMIAVALLNCGVDASYAIGGPVLGSGSGARVGGEVFVAEADESDGSFLNYRPTVEVVTNVEADHLDHFANAEEFMGIFRSFVDNLRPGGTVICCGEDAGSAELARYAASRPQPCTVVTYGRPESCADSPTVRVEDVRLDSHRVSASLVTADAAYPLELSVTGLHNVLNASAAWAACVAAGVDEGEAASALIHFQGAGRRFEERGEVAGRRVFDDYAHHPTEVSAALAQARVVAGSGRVVALFQPHLYSRTANFADRFAEALSAADEVVLADIYAAREDPVPGVTSELILNSSQMTASSIYVPAVEEAALAAADLTGEGDICILVGAGDIFLQAPTVLSRWRGRDAMRRRNQEGA